MDIKKLQALVIDALEDVKAQDIRIYDTTHLTSMFDRIAVASGTSNRQTKALAASVRDKVKAAGGNIVNMEGENTGEWVLVDLGDMVVHIMQPAIRAYYRLEELWGDKEIPLVDAKPRTSTRKPSSKKAPASAAAKKTAVPKKAVKPAPQSVSRTTPKSATKSASKTAKKSTTKTAAKTPAKTATRKTAKQPAARRTTAKT